MPSKPLKRRGLGTMASPPLTLEALLANRGARPLLNDGRLEALQSKDYFAESYAIDAGKDTSVKPPKPYQKELAEIICKHPLTASEDWGLRYDAVNVLTALGDSGMRIALFAGGRGVRDRVRYTTEVVLPHYNITTIDFLNPFTTVGEVEYDLSGYDAVAVIHADIVYMDGFMQDPYVQELRDLVAAAEEVPRLILFGDGLIDGWRPGLPKGRITTGQPSKTTSSAKRLR